MRTSTASLALIQENVRGRDCWLAHWNKAWCAFSFVGGHKELDESFRECLIREVFEELALREGTDFLVDDQLVRDLDYCSWSERAEVETRYIIRLFEVQLLDSDVIAKVSATPENCWLTKEEVFSHQTSDGRPVSSTMSRILRMVLDEPSESQ